MKRKIPQWMVVSACMTDQQGRILLQRRFDPHIPRAHGKWEFPGGRIEVNENPISALKRECKEEMGCEITVNELIPYIWTNIWADRHGKQIQAFLLCYHCVIKKGKPHPSSPEVSETRWCSLKEIKKLKMLPGTHEFIQHAHL